MHSHSLKTSVVAIATVVGLSFAAGAQADVTLSGFLNASSPSSFSIANLQNFGTSTSVTVGGDTYTGVSLYAYLNTYLAKDPNTPKNDILRDYVQASGSSGSTVYALGNLLGSGFGTQNDIIAYSDNNGTLSAPMLIAPDGSSVSNLTSLSVGHVAYPGAGTGGASTSFSVGGTVSNPTTFGSADLPGALTPQVVYVNTPPLTGQGFTGVSLWSLLVSAGISSDPATLDRSYIVATGTDNYQVVYSLEEIMPGYGNQNDLVAYENAAGGSLGTSGFARTVVPGDLKGGRYMSNLSGLTVVTLPAVVPVPGAAWMMLTGMVGIILNHTRRKLAA